MQELKRMHAEIRRELQDGNISITKSEIPFVSIGEDHAFEQLNRMMKVHVGLIGISNNVNARQQLFLATPEMSGLSTKDNLISLLTKPKNTTTMYNPLLSRMSMTLLTESRLPY